MADTETTVRGGGIGFAGWLTLLFIFLKLNPGGNFTTPIADWSWWWVLSPIWITFALAAIVLAIVGIAIVLDDRDSMSNYHKRYLKRR